MANLILEQDFKSNEEVLNYQDGSETVNDKLVSIISKIGEKISFRRFAKVIKNDNEEFGTYKHMGGRIGSLVVLQGITQEVAKDVAMHVAAMNPTSITRDEVPEEMLKKWWQEESINSIKKYV